VREEQEVPPGSLAYGVPAETRELSEAQSQQIPMYAQSYVENRKRWKEAGEYDARDR